MASSPQEGAKFALVSNGEHSIFVTLAGGYYGFSDEFSLNRRHNELVNVSQILNRLKTQVQA